MAEIILACGRKALVDADQFERLSAYKWQALDCGTSIYARRCVNNKGKTKSFSMHHEIMGFGVTVDHIDGNGLNNQKDNLRICSQAQNMQNRRKHICKTSRFKGVHWVKTHKRFHACIRVKGTLIPLGGFKDEAQAAEMYNLAANSFFGDYANLNKI